METNDIIDGVSIKLNELFGEKYTIYTNNVKQGLQFPCFFIKTLPSNKKKLIGNRYENELNLVIHMMLEEENLEEFNNISDRIYELEYIILLNGDMLKGYNMKIEISDGVLLYFITYKYFTYNETIRENDMEGISSNGEVKV